MNFYDMLYETISNDDTETLPDDKYNNMCLITYLPLDDTRVVLECGHSFNYEPLFNEIYNQKYHVSSLETQRLLNSQIKCPYCRTIQNKLLPPKDDFEQCKYVNYPRKYCMKPKQCKYTFRSGKKKGTICDRSCFDDYCSAHVRYTKPSATSSKETNEKN